MPGSECYLPSHLVDAVTVSRSSGSSDKASPTAITVFDFFGPLIFINVERFKRCIEEKILPVLKDNNEQNNTYLTPTVQVAVNNGNDCQTANSNVATCSINKPKYAIFDMGRVPYVDSKAVECLQELNAELKKLDTMLLLSNLNEQIVDCFTRCSMFDSFPVNCCFLTVHDAVFYANK